MFGARRVGGGLVGDDLVSGWRRVSGSARVAYQKTHRGADFSGVRAAGGWVMAYGSARVDHGWGGSRRSAGGGFPASAGHRVARVRVDGGRVRVVRGRDARGAFEVRALPRGDWAVR